MANGEVTGIWKRTIKKETVLIKPELFIPSDMLLKRSVEEAAKQYAEFSGKSMEIICESW